MKKSIIYFGMALLTFSSVSFANVKTAEAASSSSVGTVTPLCTAISKGEFEIVKKFIEYGADVNEKSNGMTPLMMAARYNNIQIMEYLISKGANLNTKSDIGYTALKYAELSNAQEAVEYLRAAKK